MMYRSVVNSLEDFITTSQSLFLFFVLDLILLKNDINIILIMM